MARLFWSTVAPSDLSRLNRFLAPRNPDAARRAIGAIRGGVAQLRRHPRIGRRAEGLPDGSRELLVRFGRGGYVLLYHAAGERVTVLTIRHTREAGYS